jgi:hypothetical protein
MKRMSLPITTILVSYNVFGDAKEPNFGPAPVMLSHIIVVPDLPFPPSKYNVPCAPHHSP